MDIESLKSDIDTLIEEKKSDETFNDAHDLYEFLDYDGSLHSLIDSNIEIYSYNLRQWAVDNWQHCEDAISEGLTDGKDYHKMIQAGQYKYLHEQAYQYIEKLYDKNFSNE